MQVIPWILNLILGLVNLVLGGINVYLFFENRKLKQLEVDKHLQLLEIQEEETKLKYKRLRGEKEAEMAERGLSSSGIRDGEIQGLIEEEHRELEKLQIEKEHLLQIKSKLKSKD